MIAYVEGRLAEVTDNSCVTLTSGGVGYELFLTTRALSRLPARGEIVHFYVCTVVREDALELFAFESWDERRMFLVLTSISRVGARTAMAILSVFKPDDLRRLVAEEDMISLTRVSGIGKKTGQQIFIELQYKLKGETPPPSGRNEEARPAGVLADAVAGLLNLGYAEDESLQAVKKVLADKPGLDVGEVLRAVLKTLGRGSS